MFALLVTALMSSPIPPGSTQLVLVITPSADSTSGVLFRFQRSRATRDWTRVGESWPVVVGERGLAAGLGLHRGILPRLPVKVEGDGRSPGGVFDLVEAFGFDRPAPGLRMPYRQLTETVECVDDPESVDYARITDRRSSSDWHSSERMREIPGYVWGIVVGHNPNRKKGAGSCIFLHAWSSPSGKTAGCTAMESSRIHELVNWLDERAAPVLVQLTEDLHQDLKLAWQLPE
ncbi:MAG TPA: L,D-transpeptidase family protein [Vicinamibacteria bacterium]|nr:L,D-transpeptidase family protein [Vicinamibacteria bacterium]